MYKRQVCYSAFFENTQYTGSNSNILYLLFNTTYIDSGGHVTRDSSSTFIVRINAVATKKLADFPDIYGSDGPCLQFNNPTISGVTYGVSSMLYNSSTRGRAGIIALISDTAGTNKKLLVSISGANDYVLSTIYSSSFNSTSNALFQVMTRTTMTMEISLCFLGIVFKHTLQIIYFIVYQAEI